MAPERGASAVEYGFVASLVALAVVAGATLIGEHLGAFFEFVGGMF